jgi:hypothetical protein
MLVVILIFGLFLLLLGESLGQVVVPPSLVAFLTDSCAWFGTTDGGSSFANGAEWMFQNNGSTLVGLKISRYANAMRDSFRTVDEDGFNVTSATATWIQLEIIDSTNTDIDPFWFNVSMVNATSMRVSRISRSTGVERLLTLTRLTVPSVSCPFETSNLLTYLQVGGACWSAPSDGGSKFQSGSEWRFRAVGSSFVVDLSAYNTTKTGFVASPTLQQFQLLFASRGAFSFNFFDVLPPSNGSLTMAVTLLGSQQMTYTREGTQLRSATLSRLTRPSLLCPSGTQSTSSPAETPVSTGISLLEKTTTAGETEPSTSSTAVNITLPVSVGTQNSALLVTSTLALLKTTTGTSSTLLTTTTGTSSTLSTTATGSSSALFTVTASIDVTATDVPLIAGAAAAGAVVLLVVVGVAVAVSKRCRRQSTPNSDVPTASNDGALPNESPVPQRTSEYGLMSAAALRGEYASMHADGHDVPMAASNYGAAPPAKDARDEYVSVRDDSHYATSAVDFAVKNDVSHYGAFSKAEIGE